MINKDNAGEKLLEHRIEKKLTQVQVSEKSGVTVQTLSGIESGDVKPQSMTIFKLKKYLSLFN